MESLVFVHGYMGGGAQWTDQCELFRDHFRVITPDLPGFGANYKLKAPAHIEEYADFILDKLSESGP